MNYIKKMSTLFLVIALFFGIGTTVNAATQYTVAFDPNDGVTQFPDFLKIEVEEDQLIPYTPSAPEREGYLFLGWSYAYDSEDNPVFWDFSTDMVVENITLTAEWEEGYVVAFDPDDGVTQFPQFEKVTVAKDSLISEVPSTPTRDGYIFRGWAYAFDDDDNPVLWDFSTNIVTENTTLFAVWEEVYTVVFNPNDGVTQFPQFEKVTVAKDGLISPIPSAPLRSGYLFAGWAYAYDEDDNPVFWNFDTDRVIENIELIAEWIPANTVQFNTNGGTNIPSVTIPTGSMLTKPSNPIRDGYTFVGWYTDDLFNIAYNFNSSVDTDFTLYAKWEANEIDSESTSGVTTLPVTGEQFPLLGTISIFGGIILLTGTVMNKRKAHKQAKK
ncbi:InlB B-repeat-containing protein [Culicoidibacter larvae]|uniref:LPXTG cell wall anchor domain-containing protein n=1 Tax=Culicoidibacter larvae TaxID=2579976 RepID=A0A5R8QET3_9FIRM|nr:InlB B-repeat-containing protein [Culicoidibacter larvae]TLG75486.1 hypothetical protein FEZ08_05430 [Culicoidibacter larvae]